MNISSVLTGAAYGAAAGAAFGTILALSLCKSKILQMAAIGTCVFTIGSLGRDLALHLCQGIADTALRGKVGLGIFLLEMALITAITIAFAIKFLRDAARQATF